MRRNERQPGEIGGGVFLILLVLGVGYCWFLYEGVGNFKACDAEKYPLALFCAPEDKA